MRILALVSMLGLSLQAEANVIQFLTGISYNNPSELAQIPNSEMILGGILGYADLGFSGSVLNFNTFQYDSGSNHSRTLTLLPYGRIAKRLNDKIVFGVDVTQPFNSNLDWGSDAFTRYASTQVFLTDTDISPKLGVAISQNLQLGGGINFNFLKKNEVNWALPYTATTSSTLANRTSGFGLGFNAGLTYLYNPTNIIGLTYYSKIAQNTRGYSTFGALETTNLIFNFHLPATTVLSYTHLFNQTTLVNFTAFKTEWDVNQYIRLYNTAAPPPVGPNFIIPMKYNPSYAILGLVRKQYNEKMGVALAGFMDTGPEVPNLRPLNFPSDTQFLGAIIIDYAVSKSAVVQFLYGHLYSKTILNNTVAPNGQPIPFTRGDVNINGDIVDLRLTVKV